MWHPSRRRDSKTCDPRIYQSPCFCLSLGYIFGDSVSGIGVVQPCATYMHRSLNGSGSFLSNRFPAGLKSHIRAHGRDLGVTDDSPSNCGEGGNEHSDGCRLLRRGNRHVYVCVCVWLDAHLTCLTTLMSWNTSKLSADVNIYIYIYIYIYRFSERPRIALAFACFFLYSLCVIFKKDKLTYAEIRKIFTNNNKVICRNNKNTNQSSKPSA